MKEEQVDFELAQEEPIDIMDDSVMEIYTKESNYAEKSYVEAIQDMNFFWEI